MRTTEVAFVEGFKFNSSISISLNKANKQFRIHPPLLQFGIPFLAIKTKYFLVFLDCSFGFTSVPGGYCN